MALICYTCYNVNNSTLGGLIKDYRTQKGISQLDIAFSLGWKEPSRLSRIEQGRTEKPTREILDKIISAIGLSEEEKNMLLLTGGYLPTEEEIRVIREKTKKTLHQWPYPAGMIDFSWRLISGNNHMMELYSVPTTVEKDLPIANMRVFDLLFSSELPKKKNGSNEYDLDFLRLLKQAIIEFKYEQKNRKKEKWYIEHIKKLMDNEFFRQLWVETSITKESDVLLSKYATKRFINPKDFQKMLNFYLFRVPIFQDPRFEMELEVPMDLETYSYYL